MKRKIFLFLVLIGLVIPLAAGCRMGNIAIWLDSAEIEACCVSVGDGSAYSCTDGTSWWCWGTCDPDDVCSGPNCSTP